VFDLLAVPVVGLGLSARGRNGNTYENSPNAAEKILYNRLNGVKRRASTKGGLRMTWSSG